MDVEGKKILIVDDDREMCEVVERLFSADGARVFTAHSGEMGLRALYHHRPDLVLLDIMMPGMDGHETLQQIRQLTDVPVIMLTALDSHEDIERSLYGGADDYVTKPFNVRELLARATVALRRAKANTFPADESIFDDGYLHIDLLARRVAKEGVLVKLTATEFELLAYLVKNVGQLSTHEEIIRGVWGEPLRSRVGALQTFIYQLRQKLEPNPRYPRYLLKEHSVGYRFEG